MGTKKVMLITGDSRGIGRYLVEYYAKRSYQVIGCSRNASDYKLENYEHQVVDVTDEERGKDLFFYISNTYKRLDILINNAGVASMNHALLTPIDTVRKIFDINVGGTFLFAREAAKIMQKNHFGRIVNFTSVAVPLKIEGEAVYASSKAAVISLTEILARELAIYGITVNAIGPSPIQTDLIRFVPKEKLERLLKRQAIEQWAQFSDVTNVIDFFVQPQSNFITGQVLYLGGV